MPESLFDGFEPLATQEWWEMIRKDLKGRDPEKLIRESLEGIPVKPVYRKEDLQNLPAPLPWMRGVANPWKASVRLPENPEEAEKILKSDALEGVEVLTVPVAEGIGEESSDILKQHLENGGSLRLRKNAGDFLASKWGMNPAESGFPEMPEEMNAGYLMQKNSIREKVAIMTPVPPGLRKDWQMGALLNGFLNAYDRLTDAGFTPVQAFQSIELIVPVGTNFLMEIAKLRALNGCLGRLALACEVPVEDANKPGIHATIGTHEYSRIDPQVNLLRATTASLSAVLGNSDTIEINPWNFLEGQVPSSAIRIAKNNLMLFRAESYLGTMQDPTGGSWTIEPLTWALAEAGWTRFQELETETGEEAVRAAIALAANKKEARLNTRREILVGVNNFPNPKDDLSGLGNPASIDAERPAEPFEDLRLEFSQLKNKPKAYLFTFGNPSMRSARANFALNLLGMTGMEIEESRSPGNESEMLAYIRNSQPEIVVLCSDNDSWENAPIAKIKENCPGVRVILAGKPEVPDPFSEKGIDEFIFAGMDTLEYLSILTQSFEEAAV